MRARRECQLGALRGSGAQYHHVARAPLDPGHLAWFHANLPDAGVTVLPGSGHFPHLARPEALVAILSGWD